MPRHVAIIMDGNGRWAKSRGLPRNEGHRRGIESVREVLDAARECGVPMVTLFAFSVENWKRPTSEVNALWHLLDLFLQNYLDDLIRNRIRLRVLGRVQELPEHVQLRLEKALERTSGFTEHHCNVALNYGSRTEVVDATREIARKVASGEISPDEISWETLNGHLYTAGLPDPDLLIRTSGESRISNFLLLQLAYAELYFSPVLWPDFTREHFFEAIETYKCRERRFGLTGEQLASEAILTA